MVRHAVWCEPLSGLPSSLLCGNLQGNLCEGHARKRLAFAADRRFPPLRTLFPCFLEQGTLIADQGSGGSSTGTDRTNDGRTVEAASHRGGPAGEPYVCFDPFRTFRWRQHSE